MNSEKINALVQTAIDSGKKTLTEPVAMEILGLSAIPVPRFCIVQDMEDAAKKADELGYPLVLKIISPNIVHKSDVHGVSLGIRNIKELEERMSQMILTVADDNPTASIEGFILEQMAPKGVEVIVGAVRDDQFGPAVMFGLGGVAVELMKDVTFRLAPVTKAEAIEMMREIKGWPLLTNYRGEHEKDIDAIADVIIKLSNVICETEGIKEIEINPLIVYEQGAVAVDARTMLNSKSKEKAA